MKGEMENVVVFQGRDEDGPYITFLWEIGGKEYRLGVHCDSEDPSWYFVSDDVSDYGSIEGEFGEILKNFRRE